MKQPKQAAARRPATLDECWREVAQLVFHAVDPSTLVHLRRTFYAGASALLNLERQAARNSSDIHEATARFKGLRAEVQKFNEALAAHDNLDDNPYPPAPPRK